MGEIMLRKYKYIVMGIPVVLLNSIPVVLAVKVSAWWWLGLALTVGLTVIGCSIKKLLDQTVGSITKVGE
jgi:hypothetical protein